MTKNIAIIGCGCVGTFLSNFLIDSLNDSSFFLIESNPERFEKIRCSGVITNYSDDLRQKKIRHMAGHSFKLLKKMDDLDAKCDLVIIATKDYDIEQKMIDEVNRCTDENSFVVFVQSAVSSKCYLDLKAVPMHMIINAGLDYDINRAVKLAQNFQDIKKNILPLGYLRSEDFGKMLDVKEFFGSHLPAIIEADFDRALYKKFMVNYGYGMLGVVSKFLEVNGSNDLDFNNLRISNHLTGELQIIIDKKGYGALFADNELEERLSKLKGHLNSNQRSMLDGGLVENGINDQVIEDARSLGLEDSIPNIKKLSQIFNKINDHSLSKVKDESLIQEIIKDYSSLVSIPQSSIRRIKSSDNHRAQSR